MDNLLTVDETARRLGFRPVTIRKWIAERKLEIVRVGARSVRVPESELTRLVDAGRIPARPGVVR
jgi:excisionase family DNA binding protein